MRSKDLEGQIPDLEKGRLSAEERARLSEENGYSEVRREKKRREEEARASGKRKKSNNKASSSGKEGSRNDRVKSSTKQRKKDTKRQNNILVVLLFGVALAVIALVAVFVLKINTVEVINPSELYKEASVLKYSEIETGDSMLLVNSRKAEESIEKSLPYIEKAEIKRKWPDKIVITLEYAEPAMAVDTGTGYVILNSSCKVLEKDSAVLKAPAALLKGVSLSYVAEGEIAEFTGKIDTDELIRLAAALEDSGISDISCYDLTMLSDVIVTIDSRVEVKLGTLAGATEKFAFGKEVIKRTAEKDTKHPMTVDLSTENEAYVRVKDDNSVDYNGAVTEPQEENSTSAVTENMPEIPENDTTGVVVG